MDSERTKLILTLSPKESQLLSQDEKGYWAWMKSEKVVGWFEKMFKPYRPKREDIEKILAKLALSLTTDGEHDFTVEVKTKSFKVAIGVDAENFSLWGGCYDKTKMVVLDCPYTFSNFQGKTDNTNWSKCPNIILMRP